MRVVNTFIILAVVSVLFWCMYYYRVGGYRG